eukprot:COSAG06_NODE_66_length_26393_cov_6.455161_24_plen_80_part_00
MSINSTQAGWASAADRLKTVLLSAFGLNVIILPRQARDKHGGHLKKQVYNRFLLACSNYRDNVFLNNSQNICLVRKRLF